MGKRNPLHRTLSHNCLIVAINTISIENKKYSIISNSFSVYLCVVDIHICACKINIYLIRFKVYIKLVSYSCNTLNTYCNIIYVTQTQLPMSAKQLSSKIKPRVNNTRIFNNDASEACIVCSMT